MTDKKIFRSFHELRRVSLWRDKEFAHIALIKHISGAAYEAVLIPEAPIPEHVGRPIGALEDTLKVWIFQSSSRWIIQTPGKWKVEGRGIKLFSDPSSWINPKHRMFQEAIEHAPVLYPVGRILRV